MRWTSDANWEDRGNFTRTLELPICRHLVDPILTAMYMYCYGACWVLSRLGYMAACGGDPNCLYIYSTCLHALHLMEAVLLWLVSCVHPMCINHLSSLLVPLHPGWLPILVLLPACVVLC